MKAPSPVRLVRLEYRPPGSIDPDAAKGARLEQPRHHRRRTSDPPACLRVPASASAASGYGVAGPETSSPSISPPRLSPYREDVHTLAEWLVRQVGRSRLSLRSSSMAPSARGATGSRSTTVRGDAPSSRGRCRSRARRSSSSATFGMLLGAASAVANAWAEFAGLLRHKQLRPVALVPLGASQLRRADPARAPILRWSPDARPHAMNAYGPPEPSPRGSRICWPWPRRRGRSIHHCSARCVSSIPGAPDAASKAPCGHPDVEAGWTAEIRTQAQDPHLERFRGLLPALQAKLDEMRSTHHSIFARFLNHEETLVWAAHAGEQAVEPVAERIEGVASSSAGSTARRRRRTPRARGIGSISRRGRPGVRPMAERFREVLDPILRTVARARKEWRDPPKWADPDLLRSLSIQRDSRRGRIGSCRTLPADPSACRIIPRICVRPPWRKRCSSTPAAFGLPIGSRGPNLDPADTLPDRLAPLKEGSEHPHRDVERLPDRRSRRAAAGRAELGLRPGGVFVQARRGLGDALVQRRPPLGASSRSARPMVPGSRLFSRANAR